MLTRDALRSLATADPGTPVISVYARTDPRDPANQSASPAWTVALRNGLAAVAERLEAGDDRDARLAFRGLRERIEQELTDLPPAERALSVAWFLHADGNGSERFSLRLPLRTDAVVWDARPFVSPLVDLVDRGAPTGVLLVTGDVVRLLQVEQGEPSEPGDSIFELELGDWRPFGGTGGGSSARGMRTVAHSERYEARVDAQRDHLFATAATATAKRLGDLGWERLVLVSEREVASRFRSLLPRELDERLIAETDVNLAGEDPTAIADALEPLIEHAWHDRAAALADLARERAGAGGAAALGAQETLGALAEGRVDRLLIDPGHDFSDAAGMVPEAIGGPADMLGERAVEHAIATGAEVTALDVATSDALREAGGMAALLRY